MQEYEKLHSELRKTIASVHVWRSVSLISVMAVAGTWILIVVGAIVLLPALADSAVRARLAENDAIESMRRIREAVILAEKGATFAELSARRSEQAQQSAREITTTSITLELGAGHSVAVDEVLATLVEVARNCMSDSGAPDSDIELRRRVDAYFEMLQGQSTNSEVEGT